MSKFINKKLKIRFDEADMGIFKESKNCRIIKGYRNLIKLLKKPKNAKGLMVFAYGKRKIDQDNIIKLISEKIPDNINILWASLPDKNLKMKVRTIAFD